MRIAISGFVLNQGQSGISTYLLNLLTHLNAAGAQNEYHLYVTPFGRSLLPPLSPHFHLHTASNILSHPVSNILWHNTTLPIDAKRFGYDLIHIPSIRRIPLVKGCPLIATVHDMAPFAIHDKYDPLRTFYHHQVLSRLIWRCDRILAMSYSTQRDIIQYTGYPEERIQVIYSGVDCETYKPQEEPVGTRLNLQKKYRISGPYIVYVSRIEHPAKNHLRLIQAFERMNRSADYHLVFAGADWPGAEVVREYAARSPATKRIHFLGYIPQEDAVQFYSTADLVAFPSLYEGFGFPLIEAMACGANIACSNTSSLAELSGSFAQTFDPINIDHMADVLNKSLEYPADENTRLKERGYARSFNWKETANQVLRVYSEFSTAPP